MPKIQSKRMLNRKNSEKRADVSVQFNWIFILIIGVIIITFFLSIVSKQKAQADTKISVNVVNAFKTILQSSLVKERATQMISLPNYDMEFYCDLDTCTDQGCNSGYRIKDSSVDMGSGQMSIFSPDVLKGRKMITYSFEWNMPFHIKNFLFVSADQIRYVVVNDTDPAMFFLFRRIYPDNFTTDFVKLGDLNKIKNENFYKVRYIFFNKDPNGLNLLSSIPGNVNVTAVNVKLSGKKGFGSVDYYYTKGNPISLVQYGTVNYFDNATMLAAIYSENPALYNCNMVKAFSHFARLNDIYSFKVGQLEAVYPQTGTILGCAQVFYDSTIVDENTQFSKTIIGQKSIDEDSANGIALNIDKIILMNKNARDRSCPIIY
jgi:hypothetical protein